MKTLPIHVQGRIMHEFTLSTRASDLSCCCQVGGSLVDGILAVLGGSIG
jgi:hypothetical protein